MTEAMRIAVLTSIFGFMTAVIGGLIGSLITYYFTLRLERRREKREDEKERQLKEAEARIAASAQREAFAKSLTDGVPDFLVQTDLYDLREELREEWVVRLGEKRQRRKYQRQRRKYQREFEYQDCSSILIPLIAIIFGLYLLLNYADDFLIVRLILYSLTAYIGFRLGLSVFRVIKRAFV